MVFTCMQNVVWNLFQVFDWLNAKLLPQVGQRQLPVVFMREHVKMLSTEPARERSKANVMPITETHNTCLAHYIAVVGGGWCW